ncbi:MAG: beta-galactosidase [Clostridiales bacterium]|nr:beta-galactosidase [Clostridiales bacterium]
MAQYPPIMKDKPVFLHGGDYNPEQWIKEKDTIWKMDMEYAVKAGINTLSVGIFSWSMLEPRENEYHFEWLDEVMDMLAKNGIKAVLATPSGARPAWMAEKYPEVLRVDGERRRFLFGARHNHCLTSPVYREKVRKINTLLAERYKNHPALGMWHISNEYGGECHCPLCQEKFRAWLKERYGDIDTLNDAWWNTFWSHRYSSFDQIESPSAIGEQGSHGLNLAWKRFTTQQFCDFYDWEIEPLKRITPDIPCTANLMGNYPGINYFELGRHLDRSSWDNYPMWTGDARDAQVMGLSAFRHDLMRGVCGNKPYMLMESSPSATNWQEINRLRKPGALMLQGMQAVAHGSDTVQYFQFRKGRGSSEKFHGAVISHDNSMENRSYKEVSAVGKRLSELTAALGSAPENKIAVVYDWENAWAMKDAQFGHRYNKQYDETVIAHHNALMRCGYGVDVVDETCDLSGYKMVVGPMTYMLRPGFAEKVKALVEKGGVYVSTYVSGWVNEEDLCFMNGFPGPLSDVLGIWDEETDALDATQHNHFIWEGKRYEARDWCALVHAKGASPLAEYEENFYKGYPALLVNECGEGRGYYIACRTGEDFLADFYKKVTAEAGLEPLVKKMEYGVVCTERIGANGRFLFVMNTVPEEKKVTLPACTEIENGNEMAGEVTLAPYQVLMLKRK